MYLSRNSISAILIGVDGLPCEMWKVIPRFEDYHCSNFGRVKSFKRGKTKILTPCIGGGGYLRVNLCKDGKAKNFRANRLVATLFIANPESKPEVNHLAGRFNNYYECLAWATSSENQQHAYETGLDQPKLTPAQVELLRPTRQNVRLQYTNNQQHHSRKINFRSFGSFFI